MKSKAEAMKELEIQTKLHINEVLFEKGHISEEIYKKAKMYLLSA